MKDKFKAIGLMSGTSLDGLDIAHCTFSRCDDSWEYSIDVAETTAYDDQLKDDLMKAISYPGKKILELDVKLGHFFAEKVNEFIHKHELSPDLISSHGHTIFHQPENAYTLQIASGHVIAQETGIKTINDFRSYDVKLGGQGAPLVPIGDELLFSEYIACINLGGFANISYRDKDKRRKAYDIGPCNLILNHAANKINKEYDMNGDIAKKGAINQELLTRLNSIGYYRKHAPKSLGKEWLEKEFLPLTYTSKYSTKDLLATYTEHISGIIASSLKLLDHGRVLITGGGAFNEFLIDKIKSKVNQEIYIPDKSLLEYKEAMIFAFMGVLRMLGLPNILESVTGAIHDHSAGTLYKKT